MIIQKPAVVTRSIRKLSVHRLPRSVANHYTFAANRTRNIGLSYKQLNMASTDLVLVTGGSGYIGAHCIVVALRGGYRVRTTVRSLKRADEVRSMVRAGGISEEQAKGIEFCEADLSNDKGWAEACKDCAYVLHVASPFPAGAPKHENDLIIPAKEGTLRVLKASKAAGTVRRVVVTGSGAAIGMICSLEEVDSS